MEGGGLDLASTLEAKFGVRAPNKRKMWEVLVPKGLHFNASLTLAYNNFQAINFHFVQAQTLYYSFLKKYSWYFQPL